MCGRYALKLLPEALQLPFVEESEFPQLELPWVHYNVCPGSTAPILVRPQAATAPVRQGILRPALWGLVPHWCQQSPPKRPLFNARIESAASKPSFRQAWSSQRCAVPTSGFYEWSALEAIRVPYFVPPSNGESLLWLAGLASQWTSTEGLKRWTYTVLTESSQGSPVEKYHDRIPVTLGLEQIAAWLDGSTEPGANLRSLLGTPYRVSSKVNAATVNEPDNLVAITS